MYMNLKPNKHKIYNIFKHNNHDITGVHHGWNLPPPPPPPFIKGWRCELGVQNFLLEKGDKPVKERGGGGG